MPYESTDSEKAEALLKPLSFRIMQRRQDLNGLAVYSSAVDYWDAVKLLAAALAAPAGKPVAPSMSLYELAEKLCRDERARHESLGWTPAHDEGHAEQLIDAARSYSWHVSNPAGGMPTWWPWEEKYWKPKSARLDLIRAGALYLAAEDAIQNAAQRRTIHSSFESIVQRLITEVLAREPLALLATPGKPVVSREESSPTLAATKEAATFGITLSSTSAAYIAEAVLAASGLRESREAIQAEALREAATDLEQFHTLYTSAQILRARAYGLEPSPVAIDPELDPKPWVSPLGAPYERFKAQNIAGQRRFVPRLSYSTDPADYGLEPAHD